MASFLRPLPIRLPILKTDGPTKEINSSLTLGLNRSKLYNNNDDDN